MGRNVIVSEETVRDLLEAHATLSAWYYELWAALRAANATANTPDDAARAAFVERLAFDFPEIAQVARAIHTPRMYVPAPPRARAPGSVASRLDAIPLDEEPATIIEPAPARVREVSHYDTHPPGDSEAPARPSDMPPLVKVGP